MTTETITRKPRKVLMKNLLPGLEETLAADAVSVEDLQKVVASLGGEIVAPAPAQPGATTEEVLVPGTNLYVRLPAVGKALLLIGWSVFRFSQGLGGATDAINLITALASLAGSFQTLSLEKGEKCVFLAVGTTTVHRGLTDVDYPTTNQVGKGLRGNEAWCGAKCRFHKPSTLNYTDDDVREVLEELRLKGDGVVALKGPDRWGVLL